MGVGIIHADMDAFFASVEQLDRAELRGRAVLVGGSASGRGVVSAASYEARRFGVHSAMPMARAVRLCPEAVVVGVRMERYMEVSRAIRAIFERYTPVIEPLSIDEAFLDVSGSRELHGDAVAIGRKIQGDIKGELGLGVSLGVAKNKFLAKLGSDLEKPEGFVVITDENVDAILEPLPVGRIWGVGKASEAGLNRLGIKTIGQLRGCSVEALRKVVGSGAEQLLRLARGIDDRAVETSWEAKSVSAEHTFAVDEGDVEVLKGVLLGQVEEVSRRLRGKGVKGRTVTVKCRYGDFRTITRSKSFEEGTWATETLWEYAWEVFSDWWVRSGGALRLIGFCVSSLCRGDLGAGTLFPDPVEARREELDRVVDAIKDRFGEDVVRRRG